MSSSFHPPASHNPYPRYEAVLPKIIKWAGLNGAPRYLGSGVFGSAWRVGSIVVKVTCDADEANVAALLKAHKHPNVYNVHNVAKIVELSADYPVFVIIYDYLARLSNKAIVFIDAANCLNSPRLLLKEPDDPNELKIEVTSFLELLAKQTIEEDGFPNRNMSSITFWRSLLDCSIANSGPETVFVENCFEAIERELKDTMWPTSAQGWLDWYLEAINNPETQYIFEWFCQLISVVKFLNKEVGVLPADMHSGNMCMKDDKLVLIDIGISPSNQKGDVDIIESYQR